MEKIILSIVSNVLGVPVTDLTAASSPDTVEKWDSMNHMRIVLAIEEELRIHFTDSQIVGLWDIASIVTTAHAAIAAMERNGVARE